MADESWEALLPRMLAEAGIEIEPGRSGKSEDVTLSHFAAGFGSDQIKAGSMARSERTAKWNEVIRLEERLKSAKYKGFRSPLD